MTADDPELRDCRRSQTAATVQDAVVVDDLTADDRQQRAHALEVFIGHGEAVLTEHDQIGVVANFDRADIVLLNEPLVSRSGEPERLLPRERLIPEDRLPGEVPA